MSHRPHPLILASVLLVALFVAAGSSPAQAQDAADQHMVGWSIGDMWHWTKKASPAVAANTEGDIKFRVLAAEIATQTMWDAGNHSADWKRHQTWRVRVDANQSANSAQGPVVVYSQQERFYRQDDHGIVRIEADNDFIYAEAPNSGMDRIYENFPPQIEMQFPFTVGDQWRMRVHGKSFNPDPSTCGAEGQPGCYARNNKLHTYEVVGKDRLTLKVNGVTQSFDTYRVLIIDEFGIQDAQDPGKKKYEIAWWSAKVCNFVKREEYSADRVLQYTHTLTAYTCKGTARADPSYRIYDFQNFSSTRFHGKLADDPMLCQLERRCDSNGEKVGGVVGGAGGPIQDVVNAVPGVGMSAALIGLLAVAVGYRRRRSG